MKNIIYTDTEGFAQRRIVRDGDTQQMAEYGLPNGPPNLRRLDMSRILREINNNLTDNELFTWDDVQRSNGLNAAVNIFRREVVRLYREEYRNKNRKNRS